MVEKDAELLRALAETQDENGVDVEWLRFNLSLSVIDRVEKHRRAVESVLYLRDAAERARYRPAR